MLITIVHFFKPVPKASSAATIKNVWISFGINQDVYNVIRNLESKNIQMCFYYFFKPAARTNSAATTNPVWLSAAYATLKSNALIIQTKIDAVSTIYFLLHSSVDILCITLSFCNTVYYTF